MTTSIPMTLDKNGRLLCRVINRDYDRFYNGSTPVQFIPLYRLIWTLTESVTDV